jgi:uncharacterized membrane protein
MGRFFADMNPTLRGFLIIAAIALIVIVLNLYVALASLFLIAQIAFFLAIAFFLYLFWRDRRSEIETWPGRVRFAFYGGALVILTAIGLYLVIGASGLEALALLVTIALSAVAMWRAWKSQHTYGY